MNIKCPHCGMEYEAEESDRGRRVVCELCGNGFIVGEANAPKEQVRKLPSSGVPSNPNHAGRFCSYCGAAINPQSVICPSCGVPVGRSPPAGGYGATGRAANRNAMGGETVPTHMTGAILTTIFCCQIGGIVAIIYASQVNSKLARGDIAGAKSASATAKGWIIANIVIGVIIALMLFLDGFVEGFVEGYMGA